MHMHNNLIMIFIDNPKTKKSYFEKNITILEIYESQYLRWIFFHLTEPQLHYLKSTKILTKLSYWMLRKKESTKFYLTCFEKWTQRCSNGWFKEFFYPTMFCFWQSPFHSKVKRTESQAKHCRIKKLFRLVRIILKDVKIGLGQKKVFNIFHDDANDLYDTNANFRKVSHSARISNEVLGVASFTFCYTQYGPITNVGIFPGLGVFYFCPDFQGWRS